LRPPKSTRDIQRPRIRLPVCGTDLGYEVLVAGKNDNEHEIGGEDHVDQAENPENDVVRAVRKELGDEQAEHLEEMQHEDEERGHEAEIERRQQPPAVEDDRFDDPNDLIHDAPRHLWSPPSGQHDSPLPG
jgi:hypothetical protein